jgi:hypothetical protein
LGFWAGFCGIFIFTQREASVSLLRHFPQHVLFELRWARATPRRRSCPRLSASRWHTRTGTRVTVEHRHEQHSVESEVSSAAATTMYRVPLGFDTREGCAGGRKREGGGWW